MIFVRITPMWTKIHINKPRSVQYITYANTSRGVQSPRYSNFAPRIVYQMMGSFNRYTALDNIYTLELTFGNKYEFYVYLTSHLWDSPWLAYVNTNSHKQAAKRWIYYICEYFSRNKISESFEFRSPYCLA